MDYTIPRLHIPKNGQDWYVYYSCRNNEGEMVRCKERDGINRLKTKKEKLHKGAIMVTGATNKLKSGWTPFQKPVDIPKYNQDFYWWFQERIEYSRKKFGVYNTKRLEDTMLRLKEFAPKLKVSQLDYKFLQDFELHLIKRGNIQNTVAERMVRIKIVVNEIIKAGVYPYHKNPFKQYRIQKKKTVKEKLPIEDIEKLASVKLEGLEDLARDMYVLSFYCAGIRFGDMCRLKKKNFTDNIKYTMNKTEAHKNIKLMPQAQKIILKYAEAPGEYLFDLNIDWTNEDQSIQSTDIKMLKYLKNACVKAEVKKATFHASRNAFADHSRKNNIDIYTLKGLLGHTKISTTEIYMQSFYQENSNEAMDKLFK